MTLTTSTPSPRGSALRWIGWFSFANGLVALAIALRYMGPQPLPQTPLAWAYLLTMVPGHMVSLAMIPACLIFMPMALLIPSRKVITPLLVLVSLVGIATLASDTVVFAQYKFHISYIYIDMMLKAGSQIIGFSTQTWIMAIGALLGLLIFEILLAKGIWRFVDHRPNGAKGWRVATFFIVLLISSNLIHIWADAHYNRSVTVIPRAFPLLYPATAKSFMAKRGWVDAEAYRQDKMLSKSAPGSGTLQYPIRPLLFDEEKAEPYNVLVIALDSWRWDSMTPETTPTISRFAENALSFDEHYSGGNATRVGIFSLFYGIPGTYWHAFQANQTGPVLIKTLLERGYQTGIFASAPLNSPEFDRTVFADVTDFPLSTEGATTDARDMEINRRWLSFMEKRNPEKPFFGFLFYDALHGYQYPEGSPMPFQPSWESVNYLTINNDTDPTPFLNLYKNICLFQDKLVAEVLEDLRHRELLQNTIVVITGDHGQEFNENRQNFWGHNGNFTQPQTRVPFVLHWPGVTPRRVAERSSHMDLAPTLMKNLLGCTNEPRDYTIGYDLLDPERKPLERLIMASYSKFALYDFLAKRITVQQPGGLYDLYNETLEPRPSSEINAPVLLEAMKEMGRFYK